MGQDQNCTCTSVHNLNSCKLHDRPNKIPSKVDPECLYCGGGGVQIRTDGIKIHCPGCVDRPYVQEPYSVTNWPPSAWAGRIGI